MSYSADALNQMAARVGAEAHHGADYSDYREVAAMLRQAAQQAEAIAGLREQYEQGCRGLPNHEGCERRVAELREQIATLTRERDAAFERANMVPCGSLVCPFEARAESAEAELARLRGAAHE